MNSRWVALQLDDAASTPLYLQLAGKLAEAIHAGWWQANEALPSERSLCEALSISRVTARKALDVLLQQGLISRRHGSGTFITPRLEHPLSRLTGFSEMLKAKGFQPESVWLSRLKTTPTADEVIKLGLSPNAEVCRLKRKRLADGQVMAIEISTLPASCLPDPLAVQGSLYAHLDLIGHSVVRALQHVRAINASPELAELADIPLGEAMLMMTRIGYDANNSVIELTDTYCCNDYYDFVAELKR
jgi:GntR family transcriptional regulator